MKGQTFIVLKPLILTHTSRVKFCRTNTILLTELIICMVQFRV